jgi:hypothetical protein
MTIKTNAKRGLSEKAAGTYVKRPKSPHVLIELPIESARRLKKRAKALGTTSARLLVQAVDTVADGDVIPETPERRTLVEELHRSADRAEASVEAAQREIEAYVAGKRGRTAALA